MCRLICVPYEVAPGSVVTSHKSSQVKNTRVASQVKSLLFFSSQVKSHNCSSQFKSSHFFLQVTSSQYGVVYSPFVK